MTRIPLASLVLLAGMAQGVQAQVKLEYEFAEGASWKSKTAVKVHQVLTIAAKDLPTDSEQTAVSLLSVGNRDADGHLPVSRKVESFRARLALPGGLHVAFDSANPDAKIENPDLAFLGDVFKVASGLSYTIFLDARDQAQAVEKVESGTVKLDDLDPKAKGLLKGVFEGDRLLREFRQDHGNLPAILVREGEPWDRTEVAELGAGQTLTFKVRYEYRGTVEHDCCTLDKIDVKVREVSYAMAADSPSPLKLVKEDLKVDSSEGTILFDRKLGRVVEHKVVSRIKGDLTFQAGEQELPATLDLNLDNATTQEP